ncbi:Hypothetical protein A7982_04305 [Minicystis rosea]|nr:Hypothetical protein A7982_04305 [Minicystis rosea]
MDPQRGVSKPMGCGGPAPAGKVAKSAPPSTCAEAKAVSPGGDGERALYLGGRYVSVYCKDMAESPIEYLTLPRVTNVSRYGQGPNTAPGGLTTSFTKVRFHPDTLTVDWEDATFASSTGWNAFGKTQRSSVGWGVAGDCVGNHSETGSAQIDLRGTPFAVAKDQFSTTGWFPAGSARYSTDRQVVTLTGGGYCGHTGPKSPRLQLTWIEPG